MTLKFTEVIINQEKNIVLSKREYKALKREIVDNGALYVGFNHDIFDVIFSNSFSNFLLDKVFELTDLTTEELVTDYIKNTSYSNFKKVSHYFFNHSSLRRRKKDEHLKNIFLSTILEDDETQYGGVSCLGETLDNFLSETGLEIPSVITFEWIEDINTTLKECGIKPLKLVTNVL